LRKLHLEDGWYVVGAGFCIPTDSEDEAERTIVEMMARKQVRGHEKEDSVCELFGISAGTQIKGPSFLEWEGGCALRPEFWPRLTGTKLSPFSLAQIDNIGMLGRKHVLRANTFNIFLRRKGNDKS